MGQSRSLAKRIAWTLVKLVVLVLVLWYAATQIKLADSLAVNAEALRALADAGAGQPDEFEAGVGSQARVPLIGGTALPLLAGQQFEVLEAYESSYVILVRDATTPDGRRAEVAKEYVGSGQPLEFTPGVWTLLANVHWPTLLGALALFGPAMFVMAFRWQVLLRAGGIHVPIGTIIRVHYLGLFFNSFLPGGTGGDIIKAIRVAQYTDKKAEAATLVLVDRVVGLVGVLLLAAIMVLVNWSQMQGLAQSVGLFLLVMMIGAGLFFSPAFRRMVRYDSILGRLPGAAVLKRIDSAVYDLRSRWRAVLTALGITLGLQLLAIFAFYVAGFAIGITEASFAHYLVFIPIGYLINALPISFGGLGLMEGALLKLFSDAGVATPAQGFMLGLLIRLFTIAWSLPGGLFALVGTGEQRSTQEPAAAGLSVMDPRA